MPTRWRLHACTLLCLAPLAPIALKLFSLQVARHDDIASKVTALTERTPLELLPRGRILDRDGYVLAQSLPAWSSSMDLKVLKSPCGERTSKPGCRPQYDRLPLVAEALRMDPAEVKRLARSPRRSVELRSRMGYEEAERLRRLGLKWVAFYPDEQRSYPNGDLARPLLGSVNDAGRGSSGLERSFESSLVGRSIRLNLMRDGTGQAILYEPLERPDPPPDIRLTLDRTVQFFAEDALRSALERVQAKRGTAIVQDPATGDILAMAVVPSDPMHNDAIQDYYEPGSTFKLVTAAASIEQGAMKPGERIDCESGRWKVTPSVAVKDHEGRGLLTLEEVIVHSSNIGSAKLGLRLGAGTFGRFCKLFGFGHKTGIPLPAESPGFLPGEERFDRVRLANAAFGQGVAATSLQILSAYSAVANGGLLMEPRLVLSVGGTSTRPVTVRRTVKPETIAALTDILARVVEEGTGRSARVPGYRVAGKTGTAQKIDPKTGRYSETDYVATFVGFVPAQAPRFTILVSLDTPQKGHYAAEVAAPVFASLAKQVLAYFGVEPDQPLPLKPVPASVPNA